MNRLYAVESQFSMTGANADHRLRLKGTEGRQFAADLAAALGAMPGLNVVSGTDKTKQIPGRCVKDPKAAGAEALVVAGPRQPASVQALVALINEKLGSAAVTYTKPVIDKSSSGVEALKALTGEMAAGQVSTLVILSGNPVYTAPADLQFAVALSKVAELDSPGRGGRRDRRLPPPGTSRKRTSSNPGATRPRSEGMAAIQQPMIEPMYGGKTAAEIVSTG